ncbi:hypothetical protein NB724_004275 [Pantoea ananatis]|nr:hypothetical protein [Pantoea ananatis]MCW0319124.1 hypothetical protein [Pantoea ananatis]MCW0337265.1 hypothetical protein [Pantoea ananatis]MCW0355749.1 hypothetical protein [Pantoea ananatis]MCW0385442.1 hypothetical protein [Pantoea ananatis]
MYFNPDNITFKKTTYDHTNMIKVKSLINFIRIHI